MDESEEILVALYNGPMDGKVVSALKGDTLVECYVTSKWGDKCHVYEVEVYADEIVEARYVRTRHL